MLRLSWTKIYVHGNNEKCRCRDIRLRKSEFWQELNSFIDAGFDNSGTLFINDRKQYISLYDINPISKINLYYL